MTKRIFALLLVLALLPAALFAAQAGCAELRMPGHYAAIHPSQELTIRSHIAPGGPGGYCQALYKATLTGDESRQELDELARELVTGGKTPVAGGSKHCYHGGAYETDVEFPLEAGDYKEGTYLYVCYSYGCSGGYNHELTPYFDAIATMGIRITENARPLDLEYALVTESGEVLDSGRDGGILVADLNAGPLMLEISGGTEESSEWLEAVTAGGCFGFDGEELILTPGTCGEGTVTVTVGSFQGTRTETVTVTYPCAPVAEQTVLAEPTCTEDGLGANLCHGYGVVCGSVFHEEILPALGHDVQEVHQVVERPTATRPGRGKGTCARCGIIGLDMEIPPIFRDVTADGYYSDALDFCYDWGYVTGITADTFGPLNDCMRAQVVTFLWRAEGCPEPVTNDNPFVDVPEDSFYRDAVLWAYENGITAGMDETHFNPLGICNRAQVVTFLYRTFGEPEVETEELPFTDVPADSWYDAPVRWAVEHGITSGMTATTFLPGNNCIRAQIVTFLYRAYGI